MGNRRSRSRGRGMRSRLRSHPTSAARAASRTSWRRSRRRRLRSKASQKHPNCSIIRVALTAPQPGTEGNLLDFGDCGMGPYVSQLCPLDQSYGMIHRYIKSLLIDPSVLAEKAPVQFANGSNNFAGLESRVTGMFDPTGLMLTDPIPHS